MTGGARRERKIITVVFADLVGFTARADRLDPEDVEAFLGPYHEQLRQEFERFGGTVEKFIGDAVVAVFGAPVTHEDDPERAVRAALAIRDSIREAGELEIRIAVNTGEAIVRLDASPQSGEGIATGDVLNTASRLQAAAPVNGVLVAESTYTATRDAIRYAPTEALEVRGKPEKIQVWEALEAVSRLGIDVRQGTRIPLVGRERERELLLGTLARVESESAPQLVTLVGVPGIGKSRLVYELFSEIERQAELRYWRQGRSLPYGQGVSFWSFGEMVKAQAGILEGDDGAVAAAKLQDAVRDVIPEAEAGWVEARLRPLVGLEADSEGAAEKREESFTAWRRFLEGLADRRTLVLVFEDIHWADDGLLDFIDHVIDWASGVPILVVCTTRPELFDRRPGWGGGKMNALTLALSPLSEIESARFISLVLDRSVLPLETQQALLERAGGNPLYAEQFARLYAERGSAEGLPLPDSVQGLIAARLDALSALEKGLLQDAAVMGKVFWSGALGDAAGRRGALHALERKEFIRRERRSSVAGEEEFAFRHVLVRDVSYSQIPRSERVAKHLHAAEWITGLGRPEDHAELLAHHYLAAIDLSPGGLLAEAMDKARAALQAAGDRAFALNSFESAIGYYESALRLTPVEDPSRASLLFGIGRASYRGPGGGEDALREAISRLSDGGELATAGEAEVFLGQIAWERGDGDECWQHLDRAMELVSALPASREQAFVFAIHARHLQLSGKYEEAFASGRETLALAEALGLDELRAHALNTIALARRDLNDGDGYDEMRQSIAISNALNSVESFKGYNNLSVLLEVDGRLREAEEATHESGRVAQRFGATGDLRWYHFSLPWWSLMHGEWDEALRAVDELIGDPQSGSRHYMEISVRATRAGIYAGRGDLDAALADAAILLERGRMLGEPQALFPGLGMMAYVHLERGETDEAANYLAEMLEVRRAMRRLFAFEAPSVMLWVADVLGRLEEFVGPFRAGRQTPWLEAAEQVLRGDWSAAADVYARIGADRDEAFARLRAAEQLSRKGRDAEAERQLQPALRFFAKARASRFLSQAEALLPASA
jgi:class 3 adenylate cyclase/tetratricopeptide (TPR) repeat protein